MKSPFFFFLFFLFFSPWLPGCLRIMTIYEVPLNLKTILSTLSSSIIIIVPHPSIRLGG